MLPHLSHPVTSAIIFFEKNLFITSARVNDLANIIFLIIPDFQQQDPSFGKISVRGWDDRPVCIKAVFSAVKGRNRLIFANFGLKLGNIPVRMYGGFDMIMSNKGKSIFKGPNQSPEKNGRNPQDGSGSHFFGPLQGLSQNGQTQKNMSRPLGREGKNNCPRSCSNLQHRLLLRPRMWQNGKRSLN